MRGCRRGWLERLVEISAATDGVEEEKRRKGEERDDENEKTESTVR